MKKEVRDTVAWSILQFVKVLYPIAPFISKKLSGELGVLEISWPKTQEITSDFEEAVQKTEILKDAITSIRSLKQCLHISVGEKLAIKFENADENIGKFLKNHQEVISRMAGVSFTDNVQKSVPIVLNGAILRIEIDKRINVQHEISRLNLEIENLTKMRDAAMFRLNNQDFMSKASVETIEEHKKRVNTLGDKISKMDYVIHNLETLK